MKPKRQLARTAKRNAAYLQVVKYLNGIGIEVPQKRKDAIRLFASELGFAFVTGTGSKSINDQLIDLYEDPLFTAIGRMNKGFYTSIDWLVMRQKVLEIYGSECMRCQSTENIHIDHIKPRSKYPELELDINNLQVLCSKCNIQKSNRNEVDYRPKEIVVDRTL